MSTRQPSRNYSTARHPTCPAICNSRAFARQLKHIARLEASLREEAIMQLLQGLLDGAPPRSPPTAAAASWYNICASDCWMICPWPHLQQLAAEAGVTAAHLVRRFQQATGLPPLAWQMQQRMALARRLLRAGQPIIDVALATGFADQAHFSKAFSRFCGMSPGRYRQINF
jgi:AraC-like DNA-binding protein